jgi:hypothetical protein
MALPLNALIVSSSPTSDLAAPILDEEHWHRLHQLLDCELNEESQILRAHLQHIASSYRSRVLQTVSGPARKDDRKIYSELMTCAKNASALLRSLSDDDKAVLDFLPGLPAYPSDGPKNHWLKQIGSIAGNVAKQCHAANVPTLTTLARALESLSTVLITLDGATYFHPGFTVGSDPIDPACDDRLEIFAMHLDRVTISGEQACSSYKTARGPQRRTALHLLAGELYDVIADYRATPLKLDWRPHYSNDDARFVLTYMEWVRALIPDQILKAHSWSFVQQAILDAVKEYSESRNKAQRKTPRVTT